MRPDVAAKQREVEDKGNEPGPVPPPGPPGPPPPPPGPPPTPSKTRFYGVKTLNSDKIALDFKNIADEVIAHLRQSDTSLVVRIEIEATNASGFDEADVRTVSENAKTLKFDQSGFEDD